MEKSQVLNSIKESFEKNLFSLRPKNQHHWCVRLWRISGEERYIPPIFVDFQLRTLKTLPRISKLTEKTQALGVAKEILSNYKPNTPKKEKRLEVYRKYPLLKLYLEAIHYLFLVKAYGLDGLAGLDKEYARTADFFGREKLKKLLLSPELIEHNPTAAANSVYYLKFLGIKDYEKSLLSRVGELWIKKEPEDELEWENKIYGLTHLIISASYFYQRFLPKEPFLPVLEFFEENIDEIIDRTDADIAAEVGLCFRLCGQPRSSAAGEASRFVLSRFDQKRGYIPHEENPDSRNAAEHRNVLAVLLLAEYEDFREGPDLRAFIKDKKLSLYLPKGELTKVST